MTGSYSTQLQIGAPPDAVFEYFVRPDLLIRWMGDAARLRAVEGGQFAVDINGVAIRGSYVRLERPHLIEIAWGEAGNSAMPPGSTRLVIRLTAAGDGTLLELAHSGLAPNEAERHAVGWPHFLGRLLVAARGLDPGADPWAIRPSS